VPRPALDKWSGLGLRVLTGVILAPLLLLAIYAGPPYSDALLVVSGGVAAWEWARLCRDRRQSAPWDWGASLAAASVAAALLAAAVGLFDAALWLTAAGAMAVLLWVARNSRDGDAAWSALGVVYIAPAFLFFQWLIGQTDGGLWTGFWLIAVVWGTDVGAYFAGRAIGGPKLMPAVSPKKTWAGLAGGMAVAAGAGAVAASLGEAEMLGMTAASAALAVVAQVGDLFESHLKRRGGAKDSGNLIPGHGGLLDRIDGFLAVSLVYGGYRMITGVSI